MEGALEIGAHQRWWSRLGQHAEPFREVAQLWPWVQAGELEQVAGYGAADVVDAGFLRRDALGFLERPESFPDLAAHGMSLGQVEQVPGLPLGGEAVPLVLQDQRARVGLRHAFWWVLAGDQRAGRFSRPGGWAPGAFR